MDKDYNYKTNKMQMRQRTREYLVISAQSGHLTHFEQLSGVIYLKANKSNEKIDYFCLFETIMKYVEKTLNMETISIDLLNRKLKNAPQSVFRRFYFRH